MLTRAPDSDTDIILKLKPTILLNDEEEHEVWHDKPIKSKHNSALEID